MIDSFRFHASTINHAKTQKCDAPFAFSFEAASDGNPVIYKYASHISVCIAISR